MNTIVTLMEGKKTYTGIIMILMGFLGAGDMVSEGEVATVIDAALQIAGIILSAYGRAVAKK